MFRLDSKLFWSSGKSQLVFSQVEKELFVRNCSARPDQGASVQGRIGSSGPKVIHSVVVV